MVTGDRWRERWVNTHAALTAARAECLQLRTALDDLNREVEYVLNHVGQNGAEKSKSWLIAQQRATIRTHRGAAPIVFKDSNPADHGFARNKREAT